eukprot:gene15893-33490_t
MPLQLAPTTLSQPILPNWSFNLFQVNLGATSNAKVEQAALENVGSYGKQIGRLAEALEVVIHQLKLLDIENLPRQDKDALQVFLGDVAATLRLSRSVSIDEMKLSIAALSQHSPRRLMLQLMKRRTATRLEYHSAPRETSPSPGLGAIQRRLPGLDGEAVAGVVDLQPIAGVQSPEVDPHR